MPEIYTHASLAVAASFSWCMADFLQKLGVESTPKRRRYLQSRLSRLGIDTEHWDRSPRRWYSDEALAGAVKESVSMAGVLRILGVPNTGGQHSHLSRRVKRAGIDTSHFLGQAHNRGGFRPPRPPDEVLIVLPVGSARPRRESLLKALLALGVPYECGTCGLGPVLRGRPLTMAIDHVNGDWLDNRRENLRFLCPNCHAQTSSWCRRPGARTA